jgi:nitrate/nitrite transporter NarK
MLAGRVIFGLGGESMGVAQSAIVSVWFKGSELAFALGLNMSMARLGSVINADFVPSVYDSSGLGMALTVGFILCLFSLANAVGLILLDKRAEDSAPQGQRAVVSEDDKFKWSDIWSFGTSFWLLTVSCVVTYMTVFPYL